MKTIGKMTVSTIITVLLILVIAFCVSGTVISQNEGRSKVEEAYYHEIEQEYLKEVKNYLNIQGYCNSGVTMTKVIESDGTREYTVAIHHKLISKLDESQKHELVQKCGEIEFPVDNCSFLHKIFEDEV